MIKTTPETADRGRIEENYVALEGESDLHDVAFFDVKIDRDM
jgi:hypothetical protein